ncbi:hypothetical protein [Clostridium perfringens]|uniref:hypothetical protein n=1 Tax=Clostridium perfringens TaxID=1502 RepID=UPI00372D863B
MKKNEFINQQIKEKYTTEDSTELAKKLGITLAYLRVKAKRLGVKKGSRTITNEIINGEKLCPKCCKMLSIDNFNKDKYQPNGLDYWCRSCRAKSINKKKKKTEMHISFNKNSKVSENVRTSMAFGIKKTHNPIIKILDNDGKIIDGLRCKGDFCNNSEKPLSEFYKDKNNSNGHKNVCKYCMKMKSQQNKKQRA